MRTVLTVFVLLLVLPLCAQDVVPDSVVSHPNQRVVIPNLKTTVATGGTRAAAAKAAMAVVLGALKVKCDPASELDTVLESYGDSALRTLSEKLTGVTCPVEGRLRIITAAYLANGAIDGNNLIASLIEGNPLLLEWKGNLYVLYGVVYDELLHQSGRRQNTIRELLLIDPRYAGEKRLVSFDRSQDSFAQIAGVTKISVSAP